MRLRQALVITMVAASAICVAAFACWGAMALWFRVPAVDWVRASAGAAFAAAGLGAAVLTATRHRWRALGAFAILAAAHLTWWSSILPAKTANFAPDVSRQVTGLVTGDRLTLTDVRHFAWRSETDFTPRWEIRQYDLSRLRTLDLFMSYWSGPTIAHMIMSFGFDGGEQIAWSVEVKRLDGGVYSPIADFFRNSPLVIVAADERDVIGLRTNIRGEDVQRYRLNVGPAIIRRLLLEYVEEANALAERPRFYNSLTTNCTTAVIKMGRAVDAALPLDWRLVVNGRLPEYAYAQGGLEPGRTFAELRTAASVSGKALAFGLNPGFSAAIRAP